MCPRLLLSDFQKVLRSHFLTTGQQQQSVCYLEGYFRLSFQLVLHVHDGSVDIKDRSSRQYTRIAETRCEGPELSSPSHQSDAQTGQVRLPGKDEA